MERMNRKAVSGVLLIALLMTVIGIGTQTSCGCGTGPESSAISKDQAIGILASEIIEPAAEYRGSSAFMLSEPLEAADVVTSESDEDYPIDTDTWFVFIDDEPMAGFAHDCRYVFINGETGNYDVTNETWPPDINDISMWDTQNLDRGYVIELYSILDSAVPIFGSLNTGNPSSAPTADYGDAPDGQYAYWGIKGNYPTLFSTNSSQFGRPGACAINTGEETLGMNVSAEVDANDAADPDGVPNLVDADSDERIFVIVEGTQARLAFTVTVAPSAPNMTRYVNAVIDFDQSGEWSAGTYGSEWVVINLEVDVEPGKSQTVTTPLFHWGDRSVPPSPVWMRLLLAREKVDEALFAGAGWDGSGQFEYGEVEDYFVFLTDMPLVPGYHLWPPFPGQPPQGYTQPLPAGTAQLPGPAVGTCGYNVKDYCIIINGGDNSKHIAENCSMVAASANRMAKLAGEQGYEPVAVLGPGNNTVARNNTLTLIGKAFDWLAGNVTCGDRVLVYICGHGGNSTIYPPDGGISLKDATGRTKEVLRPSKLADFLKKIPCCPDKACNLTGECCNITVVLECCYAGSFNVTGVTGECRTVIGSSNNTHSWMWSDGHIYTTGFDGDSRKVTSDRNGDGFVSPMEAHVTAVGEVDKFNRSWKWYIKEDQVPWLEPGGRCNCTCPCKLSIDAEKWILSEGSGEYEWGAESGGISVVVDEAQVRQGQDVTFTLQIGNDGECCNITQLEIGDFLPEGLSYANEAVLLRNGVSSGPREPDDIIQTVGGLTLYWDLSGIEDLAPGETITIEYNAVSSYLGTWINEFQADARCAADPSNIVSDNDTATVTVVPPDVEDVLEVSWDATCECWFTTWDSQYECDECTVTIDFWAQDISSGGNYPVTNVVLKLNGAVEYDSGSISTNYFAHTYVYEEAWCGDTIAIEVRAKNSIGEAIAADSLTCPSHPDTG